MTSLPGGSILAGLGVTAVIAAVWSGLVILGAPAQARERRLDDRRVQDLEAIGRAVDLYNSRRGALPPSLSELAAETAAMSITHDPGTKQPYEYRIVSVDKYELCARFQQPSADRGSRAVNLWSHGAGRQCFGLTAHEVLR